MPTVRSVQRFVLTKSTHALKASQDIHRVVADAPTGTSALTTAMCPRVRCMWRTRLRRFVDCDMPTFVDSADVTDGCGLVGAGGALVRASGQGRGHGRVACVASVEPRQGDAEVRNVSGRSQVSFVTGPPSWPWLGPCARPKPSHCSASGLRVILTVRLSLVPLVILLTARSQAGLEQPHRCRVAGVCRAAITHSCADVPQGFSAAPQCSTEFF
jgi:hypothetical protein